jgi:spore maturation protein CgeB
LRFLIVNTVYPAAIDWVYQSRPGLDRSSYSEQVTCFLDALPGVAGFYARNLDRLGYSADVVIANNDRAQRAWATEHGLRFSASTALHHRVLRRLRVPTVRADPAHTILAAQVRGLHPDVLLNLSVDGIQPSVFSVLKPYVGVLVGETDAALPLKEDYSSYDLLRCSLPSHLEHFRRRGQAAVPYRFGFEPQVLERVGAPTRDIGLSWVGSLSRMHARRIVTLERIAAEHDLDVWAPSLDSVSANSPLRRRYHGPAWGYDNYTLMARSAMTVNAQIDTAAEFTDNIRLYEATGLGALLLTDLRTNLPDLFDIGQEIVAYKDANDCVRLIKHFSEHPVERAQIATAGQARTLREHTYYHRMRELVDVLEQPELRQTAHI